MPSDHKSNAIATSDYEAAYPHPISVKKGDPVAVGKQDTEWPGWVWCTDRGGVEGWVPEQYLERLDDRGKMLRDYNAIELSIRQGERLTLGEEANGWFWATNEQGQSGWVPAKHVRLQEIKP